ncbi:MAG TPA: hypothetical protein VGW75_07670, partial [Solirubrobacteraceae bacterium]|nr:hypothetical protein [Solirubrobacteraceae bacterium]
MLEQIAKALGDVVSITPGGLPSLLVVVAAVIALVVLTRLGLGPVGLRDALTDRRRDARSTSAEEYR